MPDAPQLDKTLAGLVDEIRACRHCVENPDKAPLPHEPRPVIRVSSTARICVCGQAPGTRVHASGLSFMDPSGKRLRDWMGVDEEEFYDETRVAIVPMGFCFPGLDDKGGDLPPRPECAKLWHERLFAALPQFELIILVGHYAQKWHLGRQAKKSLTETVRHWRDYSDAKEGPVLIPTPHPSWRNTGWLKKNPWFEAKTVPFLQRRVKRLL